ncbi:MAG: hypothetical protein IT428_19790 [Planctomycetaceae bacterium]|nr:hypothetical protein [Planctomycetaceae bacterium]
MSGEPAKTVTIEDDGYFKVEIGGKTLLVDPFDVIDEITERRKTAGDDASFAKVTQGYLAEVHGVKVSVRAAMRFADAMNEENGRTAAFFDKTPNSASTTAPTPPDLVDASVPASS